MKSKKLRCLHPAVACFGEVLGVLPEGPACIERQPKTSKNCSGPCCSLLQSSNTAVQSTRITQEQMRMAWNRTVFCILTAPSVANGPPEPHTGKVWSCCSSLEFESLWPEFALPLLTLMLLPVHWALPVDEVTPTQVPKAGLSLTIKKNCRLREKVNLIETSSAWFHR